MIKKYIITNGQPILFSAEINHADMINKVSNIESAGFFIITNDGEKSTDNVVCMGKSISLAVHSRPEIDQKIIKEFLSKEE